MDYFEAKGFFAARVSIKLSRIAVFYPETANRRRGLFIEPGPAL